MKSPSQHDKRYMAAAIRLARRHEGLTGTNPSVACVLVSDNGQGPFIAGSGITAKGGRPHAEPVALEQAGKAANGATAYVTLEPCAHHGSTPPCAQTLIDAGVKRVVTAMVDPDERVNEKGHAMLRDAGIEVMSGCLQEYSFAGLATYLNQKSNNRAYVTVKIAVSCDGHIGVEGKGQVQITGSVANAQTHLLRARHHAILVGAGTVIADDPELTCRIEGLEQRSPIRIILDPHGRVPLNAKVFASAGKVRTLVAAPNTLDAARQQALKERGVEILNCELVDGRVALPELLEDLCAAGIPDVLVEGGAEVVKSFLNADLVDELIVLRGPEKIATRNYVLPVKCPVKGPDLQRFDKAGALFLGDDTMIHYKRAGQVK